MDAAGKRYLLDKPLSDILGHLYAIQLPAASKASTYHLGPNLEMMLVLNFGSPVRYHFGAESKIRKIERIAVLGPLRQMMSYELMGGADLITLPFIHDGFYRFLKLPVDQVQVEADASKIAKQMLVLETLWAVLARVADPELRIQTLKSWLLNHIYPREHQTQALITGITAIHDALVNPVAVMAEESALSERTIQLRFKKYTGYSPKELLRFLRFKAVIRFLEANQDAKVDWFELILQFGYHDQSHMIKDFKYYTGTTPNNFRKLMESGSFCIGRD